MILYVRLPTHEILPVQVGGFRSVVLVERQVPLERLWNPVGFRQQVSPAARPRCRWGSAPLSCKRCCNRWFCSLKAVSVPWRSVFLLPCWRTGREIIKFWVRPVSLAGSPRTGGRASACPLRCPRIPVSAIPIFEAVRRSMFPTVSYVP